MELWYVVHGMPKKGRPTRSSKNLRPRRMWTEEENVLLERLVAEHGPRKWHRLEKYFEGRKGTHLRSHYKHAIEKREGKRPFTPEEDAYILRERERLGGKWSLITSRMDHRVDNDVKNRWRLLMRRKAAEDCEQNREASPSGFSPENE